MSTIAEQATAVDSMEHMPGCRCEEYWADAEDSLGRAVMVSERRWSDEGPIGDRMDLLLAGSLLTALQSATRAAGVPFVRICESRWNDLGEPIGPRLESRVCEMVEYRFLRREVSRVIEETVRRMLESRCESK